MTKTKIFSVVFFIISLGLAYYLYTAIKEPIEEKKKIERIEAQVIEKLKTIRDVQRVFYNTYGRYADSWPAVKGFIEQGKIYRTVRSEEIIVRKYGGDSVAVTYDTLGYTSVKDSLFNERKGTNYKVENIDKIPHSGEQFELWADRETRGEITVDLIEVRDVAPVNPARSEENQMRNKKPLRFGSRTEVTTSGNWE